MEATAKAFSWRIWALAAFALLALVMAVAAPRLTEELDAEAGRLRAFEGLALAQAVAAVAERGAAPSPEALREAAAALMAEADLRRVFFVSEGGVDDYGIATGREFLYDSQTGQRAIGEADKALLDLVTRVADAAGGAAAGEVPLRLLVNPGAGEGAETRRFVVLLPAYREGRLLGVAGIVRELGPYPVPPLFLWALGLALAGAGLFALVRRRLTSPRRGFGLASLVILLAALAGGYAAMRTTQGDLAAGQARALARAEAAAGRFDAAPLWALVGASDEAQLITRGEAGWAAAPAAVATRSLDRMVLPAGVLVLGLLIALWTLGGTAALIDGVRGQPTTYLYVLPVLLAMGAVIFYPFLKGVEFAFLDANAQSFVGLANFEEVLVPSATAQASFYRTLGVTVLWTFLNVLLHVSIGLALALLLNNQRLRFKGLYRVLLIVPWAMPNYITALTWKTMFNTQYGAVNILLQSVGIDGPNWFGPEFVTNFSANLTTNVWLGFPFMMVVSLGALQSIPTDLYEAADIDGAGRWQKFRSVTLPLLKPALFPAIILGTIWTFNQFNVIYLVSGGGPDHKTEILITEAYYLFKVLGQYGIAAAYCLMIFLILLLYTVMTNRITRATEGAFD